MSTLGSCETWVSRSIKRVFQLLLKDAFTSRFGYNGPRHTLLFRDLAFLPHVIQTDLPWRRIRLELVRSFLDIDSRRWGHCLHAPHSLDRSSARLVDIGNAQVRKKYCCNIFQDCKLQNPSLLPHQVVTGLVELLYLCLLAMY